MVTLDIMERTCEHCQQPFSTTNGKKKYCSPRCNKLHYQAKRCERDDVFRKRMASCWQKYGMDACPKCGRMKRKSLAVCKYCVKIDERININAMADDSESLFSNPESLLKMEIMMAVTSHPGITAEELLEMFRIAVDDVPMEKIVALIQEVLEIEKKDGDVNG